MDQTTFSSDIVGGPVTCVQLLHDDLLLLTKGANLECWSLKRHRRQFRRLVFPQHDSSVHGVRPFRNNNGSTTKYCAFGGRQVAVFCLNDDSYNVTIQVSDWIWDVHVKEQNVNTSEHYYLLFMATANNAVELWAFKKEGFEKRNRIVCNKRCITYSMALFVPQDRNDEVRLVCGTVMNEVLVWSVWKQQEDGHCTDVLTVRRDVQQVLKGHLGAVYSVRVCSDDDKIASTSDDRTVRLWKQQQQQDGFYVLHWTGWNGHVSRIWDCTFISNHVVTVGEDGTAQMWNVETGQHEGTVYNGNESNSLWTISSHGNTVAMGANNGTVKIVWNVSGEKGDEQVLLVPDDRPAQKLAVDQDDNSRHQQDDKLNSSNDLEMQSTTNTIIPTKASKKKKKKDRQVVFAIKLHNSKDGKKLLIATKCGSLLSCTLNQSQWTELDPWWTPDAELPFTSQDGSCLAISSSLAVVGTTTGHGVIVSLPLSSLSRMLFSSPHAQSTRGLQWLNDETLVAFYIRGIVILWNVTVEDNTVSVVAHCVLSMDTVGIPMSCTCHCDDWLLVGDSRGNIASFNIQNLLPDQVQHPTSTALRVHKKEHVNEMLVLDSDGKNERLLVLSVGNDGCLCETFMKDGQLKKALSIPTASFRGITTVWRVSHHARRGDGSIVIGGFHGNFFSLFDVTKRHEICRINTGGRQRSQDFIVDFVETSIDGLSQLVPLLAVCVATRTGRNEIHVHRGAQDSSVIPGPVDCLGVALHIETVYDVSFCETPQGLLVLSGGEDCSARLSCFSDETLVHSKMLEPHESCVRATCSSRGAESTLLVTCGGKLSMKIYLLYHDFEFPTEYLPVCFLGQGRSSAKASIDHRINAVKATKLHSADDNSETHLIVTGDSNGALVLFFVNLKDNDRQSPITNQVMHVADRPILSIALFQLESRVLVFAGTTGGEVLIWSIPVRASDYREVSFPLDPFLSYRAHGMGTNSIDATMTEENDAFSYILICTGGDDQAISLCGLNVKHNDTANQSCISIEIESLVSSREASISAIKGVRFINANLLVSVGYSQLLSFWTYHQRSMNLKVCDTLCQTCCVGDINSIACFSRGEKQGEKQAVLVVGGEGLQQIIFSQ